MDCLNQDRTDADKFGKDCPIKERLASYRDGLGRSDGALDSIEVAASNRIGSRGLSPESTGVRLDFLCVPFWRSLTLDHVSDRSNWPTMASGKRLQPIFCRPRMHSSAVLRRRSDQAGGESSPSREPCCSPSEWFIKSLGAQVKIFIKLAFRIIFLKTSGAAGEGPAPPCKPFRFVFFYETREAITWQFIALSPLIWVATSHHCWVI